MTLILFLIIQHNVPLVPGIVFIVYIDEIENKDRAASSSTKVRKESRYCALKNIILFQINRHM